MAAVDKREKIDHYLSNTVRMFNGGFGHNGLALGPRAPSCFHDKSPEHAPKTLRKKGTKTLQN